MARRKAKTRYRTVYKKAKRSYKRAGGFNGLIKPALVGIIAGMLAPKVPVVNTLPYNRAIAGAGANYFLGGRTTKKMIIGAAAGHFISPYVSNMMGMGASAATNTGKLF